MVHRAMEALIGEIRRGSFIQTDSKRRKANITKHSDNALFQLDYTKPWPRSGTYHILERNGIEGLFETVAGSHL